MSLQIVQNQQLKPIGDKVAIDTQLSTTSENAISNKAVTEEINRINSDLNAGYVSVIANGVKTIKQLFNSLFALIDPTKIRMGKSYIDMGGFRTFYITQKANTYDLIGFAMPNVIIEVSLSSDSTYTYNVVQGGTTTDRSSDVPPVNVEIKFVY